MADNRRRILYLTHAGEGVYAAYRARVPEGFELLTLERDDDDERRAKIALADAVINAPAVLTDAVAAAASDRLRLVQHQGVGWQNHAPLEWMKARGVRYAINPSGTAETVSEHALTLMLACLRHVARADAALRRGEFLLTQLRPISRNLRGLTVGIVGMGRIGSAVAALLQPFRVRGLYADPYARMPEGFEIMLGFQRVELDTLLAESDVVTLHCPHTDETHRMISRERLALMKPDAVLVNCARGPIVDEAALAEALRAGRLGSAGIDVFDPEPPRPGNPLYDLPNTVLTPHIAGGTSDALRAKVEGVMANIERFFRDGTLHDEVIF
jgi:phosphoglycerate dehydrogenase-like enzyme